MDALIASFLDLINETLAAAIVVIAASMLLYNLTRNLRDRVARTSGVVLGCVTAAYLCDIFLSLGPGLGTYIADAALAVGRHRLHARRHVPPLRRAAGDDRIALARAAAPRDPHPLPDQRGLSAAGRLHQPADHAGAGHPGVFRSGHLRQPASGRPSFRSTSPSSSMATGVAFINVQRARARCLTRNTRRRMGYLQVAMLTPAVGIFPFSVLLGPGQEYSLIGLFLVNLTNVVVVFMLLFLAYPLSFFGSRIPDRVVKTELLRFILRGPATGLLALVTIIFTTPATRILGLPGQSFMPFAVVAVVLLWQWSVALALPYLERRLVYSGEEAEQIEKLSNLSERLLARGDLLQLLEAILASACDYLRVNSAFVTLLNEEAPELIGFVGSIRPTAALLQEEADTLRDLLTYDDDARISSASRRGRLTGSSRSTAGTAASSATAARRRSASWAFRRAPAKST